MSSSINAEKIKALYYYCLFYSLATEVTLRKDSETLALALWGMYVPPEYFGEGEEEGGDIIVEPEIEEGGMDVEEQQRGVIEAVRRFFFNPRPVIRTAPLVEVTREAAQKRRARESMRQRDAEERHQKRLHIVEEVREEAGRRGAFVYIGERSLVERKQLFIHYFRQDNPDTLHGRQDFPDPIKLKAFIQNPYDETTWRGTSSLSLANRRRLPSTQITGDEFRHHYQIKNMQGETAQSITRPDLFDVELQNPALFKEILYGENKLLMKVIPLVKPDGLSISEFELRTIYNEIQAAYFLNELLYGYTHVLSVHFMIIVDWFQTPRSQLGFAKSPFDSTYHQITIAEKATDRFDSFISAHPTLGVLRAALFQIFHALEIAWLTNQYVHGDLHLGNVLFKRVDSPESPFQDKTFLYKRLGHPDWYVLEQSDLHNHMIKIIDFGYSRLYVPSKSDHLLPDEPHRHKHDRLISFGFDWTSAGYPLDRANRQIDVRMVMLDILVPDDPMYWQKMSAQESALLFEFADEILDFDEMNRIIDRAPQTFELRKSQSLQEERLNNAGGRLQANNLHRTRNIYNYLATHYRRQYTGRGPTVSDALNHRFFDPLRRAPLLANGPRPQHANEVVLSFPTTENEVTMLNAQKKSLDAHLSDSPSSLNIRCVICGEHASLFNREKKNIVPLCGALCAEFKYLYQGKTVFR